MRKLMAFIDGTNVLIEMAKRIEASHSAHNPDDDILQLATMSINGLIQRLRGDAGLTDIVVMRKYWFGSHHGSQETYNHLRTYLRKREFEPIIFQKIKAGREKGVDIGVAKEMLINAFQHNYEFALLITGDEDYVGLVQDVKRYGAIVIGAFLQNGRAPELELTCDKFVPLGIEGIGHKELVAEIRKKHPPKGKVELHLES